MRKFYMQLIKKIFYRLYLRLQTITAIFFFLETKNSNRESRNNLRVEVGKLATGKNYIVSTIWTPRIFIQIFELFIEQNQPIFTQTEKNRTRLKLKSLRYHNTLLKKYIIYLLKKKYELPGEGGRKNRINTRLQF